MAREVITVAIIVDLEDTTVDDVVQSIGDVCGVGGVDVLDARSVDEDDEE